MNIFEDLIEELKEENLIEQTVIETSRAEAEAAASKQEAIETAEPTPLQTEEYLENAPLENIENSEDAVFVEAQKPIVSEDEFYRQRAINEVAFLHVIEAVFAGVEREQLKTTPQPFNDLEVKKVLHAFLQVCCESNSPEFSKAEFQLLQETENWYSSLTLRDNRIMTAHLRRYCETSRPALSSPAMIALAKFYRNSPYTESVRSKFDLIVTRLFSKEVGNRREAIFTRAELINHIQELYAEWSSVPLYSTEANDPTILQTVRQFDEFIEEAENVEFFDELINSNFFNRVRLYKESTNEDFYAPFVCAAAAECNVRIGNRYIELLEREKRAGNVVNLQSKYGLAHDSAISEATGKTLALSELLKEQKKSEPKSAPEKKTIVVEPIVKKEEKKEDKKTGAKGKSAGFNLWLLIPIIALVALLAFYFGTKTAPVAIKDNANAAPKMNLENSMLKEYLQEAHIEDDTLDGIVLPTWGHLTEEKRRDVLKQMLNFGSDKGYKKVRLTDKSGKTVGTAANGTITISD
ncbi:MAG: hypothetical protein ACR2HG_11855 [Pyrinomonadaceae bacterium]